MIDRYDVKLTAYVSMDQDWRIETITVYAHGPDDAKRRALDQLEKTASTVHRSLWQTVSIDKINPKHKVAI